MKKKLMVLAFVLVLSAGSAFAVQDGFGIGVLGSGGMGWGRDGGIGGAALSLKLPGMPIYWGVDFNLEGNNGFWIGATGDFIHLVDNQSLVKDIGLSWFIRAGLYGKVFIGGNNLALDAGVRLPIGLSWQPIRLLEVFLDVAPSIGLGVSFGNPARLSLGGGFVGEFGIRLWF
jgi:hypothetical protein